jgi:hypothetical protein
VIKSFSQPTRALKSPHNIILPWSWCLIMSFSIRSRIEQSWMNRLNIKLCFWNIGGLKSKTHNKLSDPIFLQHIFKHDIILLAETHVGYGEAVNILRSRIEQSWL